MKTNDRSLNGDDSGNGGGDGYVIDEAALRAMRDKLNELARRVEAAKRGALEQQYRADFDADECIRAALDAVDDHSDREEIAAEAYRVAARKWRQRAIGEGLAPLGGLTEEPRIEAELRPDGRRIDVVGTVLDWRAGEPATGGPWKGVGHLDSGSVWAAPVGSVPPEGPLRPLSVPLAAEQRRVNITATLEPCEACRAALIVVNGVTRGRVVFGGTVERPTVTAHRDDCPAGTAPGGPASA